jgi:hypothetical protein
MDVYTHTHQHTVVVYMDRCLQTHAECLVYSNYSNYSKISNYSKCLRHTQSVWFIQIIQILQNQGGEGFMQSSERVEGRVSLFL